MTLDGTNTWLLQEPGASRSVIVDPGPIQDGHLDLLDEQTGEVALILVTHHHFDHSEVAHELGRRKGCAVRALDPAYCFGAEPVTDGERLQVDGLDLRILTTPGHTADSISIVVPGDRALLSGDTVLGRGTTVVAHPDGQLAPYLDSLAKMQDLVATGEVDAVWPAHGPVLTDAEAVLDFYVAHRRDRLAQVAAAVQELGADPAEGRDGLARQVVEVVYADVDQVLWPAAERSVLAQLAYLASA